MKFFDCVADGMEVGIPIVGFGDSVNCGRGVLQGCCNPCVNAEGIDFCIFWRGVGE